ncbi:MAG: ankyrin repeat domain-containing protein [Chloroflexi bacterium]|nr:ankyrin repeat domain-containing protein [Chloroflexota bacterium]MBU1747395.1 ankyrin repeat domain-containing protein [Chloroflexota bacterium]
MSWIRQLLGKRKPDPKPHPPDYLEPHSPDYLALAEIFDKEWTPQADSVQTRARAILLAGGSDAVDAIMQVVARESWGRQPLGLLLAEIGDRRAVPLLKKLLDRGKFTHFPGGEEKIRAFVFKGDEGSSPESADRLNAAVKCGDTEEVCKLLGEGINVNARGRCGFSPLDTAVLSLDFAR